MGSLSVIWWRDIPAQVVAREGRVSNKHILPGRFQEAIDRAAVKAGLAGTDDYLAEWRRENRPCGDDLEAEVAAEVALLEAAYPADRLKALATAGGVAADAS
ncbi:MAG: virulence factor [Candidatus Limnocylindrales bacterium]